APAALRTGAEPGDQLRLQHRLRPREAAWDEQRVDRAADVADRRLDPDPDARGRDDVVAVERGDTNVVGVAAGQRGRDREDLGGPGDVEDLAALPRQHDDGTRAH